MTGGMPRPLRRLLAVVVIAAVLFALVLPNLPYIPYVGRPWPHSSSGAKLTDIQSVEDLQARFNQDSGSTRLILLLSPT